MRSFGPGRPVWAAVTQGDPTAFNLGWTPDTGPFWFDYDTAGPCAIAGEFAVFLVDLLLHGPRFTPVMNPAAYRDYPAATARSPGAGATVRRARLGLIEADLHHQASSARRGSPRPTCVTLSTPPTWPCPTPSCFSPRSPTSPTPTSSRQTCST